MCRMSQFTEGFLKRNNGFVPKLLTASTRGAHRIEDAFEFAFALDDVDTGTRLPDLGKRASRFHDPHGSLGLRVLVTFGSSAVLEVLAQASLAVVKEGAMRDAPANAEALKRYGFKDERTPAGRRETGAQLAARMLTCLAADYAWVPYARGVHDAREAAPSSLRTDIWAASATIHAWAMTDHPALARALGAVLSGPGDQVRPFPSFVELFKRVSSPWLLGPPGFVRASAADVLDECCEAAAQAVSMCLVDSADPAGIRRARIADEVIRTFGEFFALDLRANWPPPDRSASPSVRSGAVENTAIASIERRAAGLRRHTVGLRPPARGKPREMTVESARPLLVENQERVAYARAYLTRVRILRKERESVRAQELWNKAPIPDWLDPVDSPDSDARERFLSEQNRLECARLKLRVHDRHGVREPRAHSDACAELYAMKARLIPDDSDAKPPSNRRLRLVTELADALTAAGDDDAAAEVTKYLLGANPDGHISLDQFRRIFERDPRQRIVDLVQRQATRLSRQAYLLALGGERTQARILLGRARAAAEATAEVAVRPYPALAVRATLARIEVEEAALVENTEKRRELLEIAAARALQVYLDSRVAKEVPPDRLAIREGHYGAALAEIASGRGPDTHEIALEATVRLYPQIHRYEVDGNDDPARSIRYGDACAACGEQAQAVTTWRRILGRFERVGLTSQTRIAVPALEERLDAIGR